MQKIPSSVVGKYQIVDLVGEGAMGNVYRAQDPVLNRTVAIKVMSDAIARDAALRDRFMREAQAAGSLQHPNVVTIYDFGEVDGHLFIAMEYVDGVDVSDLIERNEPISIEDRIGIAIDVLLGLSYAHKRGVVHRDIKPANIRITEDGHAKIMDFGVAHLESTKMTATGMMVGTPNYMAPEQVTGQKIGPATDIFAVGAVLYELLSHKKAFGADSLHNVLFKVVSEDPPPLALVAPDVPRALDAVLRKALAKDADQRYQTAQEMADALTSVRATLTPGARTLSLGATIARQTAERKVAPNASGVRWTTAHLLAVAAVAAVALVGLTWMYASSRQGGLVLAARDSVPPQLSAAAPTGTARVDSPTVTPPAAVQSRPEETKQPERQAEKSSARTGIDADRAAAAVRSIRGVALRARTAAADGGAFPTQLAEGDRRLAESDRLTRSGKYPEAVAALNLAMASWTQIQPSRPTSPAPSNERRIDSAQERPAPTPIPPSVSSPPLSNPTSSATVGAPPLSPSATGRSEPAPRPASADIAALISEYARAIESRDLGRIRALYPAMTQAQQRGFQQFFERVRELRATLVAAAPTVSGSNANAQVTGAYEFTDASGKAQRQPVTFNATFRNDGARWLIVAVR